MMTGERLYILCLFCLLLFIYIYMYVYMYTWGEESSSVCRQIPYNILFQDKQGGKKDKKERGDNIW